MLRRAGGNPAITNHLGLTPLSYACVFKLSMELEGGGDWEDRQVTLVHLKYPTSLLLIQGVGSWWVMKRPISPRSILTKRISRLIYIFTGIIVTTFSYHCRGSSCEQVLSGNSCARMLSEKRVRVACRTSCPSRIIDQQLTFKTACFCA